NVSRRVDGVNLKNALGQIKAHGGNLHGGWLLSSGCLTANPLWHCDAGSGSHPPHLLSGKGDAGFYGRNAAQSCHQNRFCVCATRRVSHVDIVAN
ncbi:hypothetical protein ACFX5Q_33660, partial [Mesorhizobium sp. IMUNJ 23033]|uniref:hypothetical protein n=1 Tax=Mesorhizobium sp. IMUNJ 23033 TaxID=3378039 RepID=UPI00384BEDBD